MDLIVFPMAALLGLATLLPAVALFVILTRRFRQERSNHRRALEEIEAGSGTAMISIDESGKILSCNAIAQRLFEHPDQSLVGASIGTIIPALGTGSDGLLQLDSLHSARKTPNGNGVEVTGQRKNGTYIPLDLTMAEVSRGGQKRFFLVARDLSEIHDAERNARELQFLDGMMQSVGAPVIVLYKDGKITRHNRCFEEATGHADPFGRHYWELLLPSSEWPQARHMISEVIGAGETKRLECSWFKLTGEAVPMLLAISPLRAGNVTAEHAVIVAFPASGQAESGRAAAMEAVERLAGGIAQQFNDLLTSINGYSELVLHTIEDQSPARRDVEEIKKAGERGAALTSQLLAFSQRQVLHPEAFSLNDLIHGIKGMLDILVEDKVTLSTVLDLELGLVNADRNWMEQVILNLVVNARDAMPAGGKLTLETKNVDLEESEARRQANLPEGRYVVLNVCDTGTGLEPAARQHLFEPFFTTKRAKGAGLGLSTVYGFVRQSGGNTIVHSMPTGGTSVRVYLPRHMAAAESAEKSPAGLYLVRGAGR